jgi:hypothetical protein
VSRPRGEILDLVDALWRASRSVLRIRGLKPDATVWVRNVRDSKDPRYGPWRCFLEYEVLDSDAWKRRECCVYFLRANDGGFRYVGYAGSSLRVRWKTVPAKELSTGTLLPYKPPFHSQCFKPLSEELLGGTGSVPYELRVLFADQIEFPGGANALEKHLRSCRFDSHRPADSLFPWNKV